MKKFLAGSILWMVTQICFAQSPSGFTKPPEENKIGYGKIKGEVVDKNTGEGIAFATVSIIDVNTQKPIGGTIASDNGKFVVNNLKKGMYKVVLSFIGYSELSIEGIEIFEKGNTENLGKLYLEEAVTELEEVVVEGEKELVEEKVDRLIYNAESDATTAGGDATDVLRRVPLLTVDLDGNLSLRGSQNIKVLIDNRPSTISAGSIADALKQIPADQIKSVEVITSPSAKYDAEGTGGIINIITKKNNFEGSTLSVNSGVGLRATNLGLNGSVKKGRHGLSLGGFGRAGYNITGEFSNDQILTDSETLNQTLTTQKASTDNNLLFGRYTLGWDYEFNKYNWLSTSVKYGVFNMGGSQHNLLTQSFRNNELLNQTTQNVDFINHSKTVDVSMNFIKSYEKKGKEISFLSLYSQNNRTNDFENISIEPTTNRFKNENKSNNKELTFQVDYVNPVNDKSIIEFGAKNILRMVNSDYTYFTSEGPDDPYQPSLDEQFTNIFNYEQNITAGYFSLTQSLGKDYSLKAGLRYEYTTISANFSNEETVEIPSYGTLVPSINFSKKLKQGNMIKLAYNRRIQRPSLEFLNPNVNATNPKNITQGNPNLNPEFTDNFEASYGAYKGSKSINISAFVRNTSGSIQQVRSVFSEDVTYSTYENIGKESAYGLSLFGNLRFGKKAMINTGIDMYYAVLDNNLEDPLYKASNSGMVVSGRLFGSYNLTEKWSLQGFAFARGRNIQLQGYQSGFYMYSLSLNRNFKDKKGSIGIGAENFLTGQMKMITESSSPLFTQSSTNTMNNLNFKINFSYRLGKMDFGANSRRKGRKVENDDLKKSGGDYNSQMSN
ncbi:outer membrane beta-barrel family protein [Flexithrix dorotheae]|uniref:outer membrane beta-barrel family protein n=1 Tax=Flexithrix dorotheae TaxID=70993 RepID=UPI00146ACC4C|nr:outer membrane beta-barrel family protein [Flexithrix dorotheae]